MLFSSWHRSAADRLVFTNIVDLSLIHVTAPDKLIFNTVDLSLIRVTAPDKLVFNTVDFFVDSQLAADECCT